jgi:hypothetical protein
MPNAYDLAYRDPRWIARRMELLRSRHHICEECTKRRAYLEVHHTEYIPGRAPWDYPSYCLVVLCRNCHQRLHDAGLLPDARQRPLFPLGELLPLLKRPRGPGSSGSAAA